MAVQDSMECEAEQKIEAGKPLTDEQLKEIVGWVEKARTVYYDEVKPVQDRLNTESQRIYDESNAHRQLLSRLKRIEDDSLERTRREIDQLTSRLDVLLKFEEVLTDMDDDAVEKATKKAEEKIKELSTARSEVQRPLNEEMADVHRAYAEDHRPFGDSLKPLFIQEIKGKFSDYKFEHIGGAFSNGQATLSYEKDRKVISISLIFVNGDQSEKYLKGKELLNERYRIINESNRSMYLYTQGVRINLSSSRADLKKGELREFFEAVIDQPKMDQLLEGIKQ